MKQQLIEGHAGSYVAVAYRMYCRLPLFLSVRLIAKPTIATRNPSIRMPPRSPKMIAIALLVECPTLLPKMESYNNILLKYCSMTERTRERERQREGGRERERGWERGRGRGREGERGRGEGEMERERERERKRAER